MTSARTTAELPEGTIGIVARASRRIGAAIARALASVGATVVLAARTETEPAAIADPITEEGDRAFPFVATSFGRHAAIGWVTTALCLIAVAVAALDRRELSASVWLFTVVVVIQVALGVLSEKTSAWFGAMHGLNALSVAGAAANLARRTPTSHRPHTDPSPTPRWEPHDLHARPRVVPHHP